jgi:ribosomal protein S18 acetylase RimI-like enzyme
MHSGPIIRAARPDEYVGVGELTADAYSQVLADGDDDPYRVVLLDAAGRARDAELLVAVDDEDTLLGTVTVGRPGTTLAEVGTPDEVEVRMLAVARSAARRGIGRTLMQYVNDVARREGFAGIVLSVISTNAGAADFYRELGYRRVPSRDWYPREDIELQVWSFTL